MNRAFFLLTIAAFFATILSGCGGLRIERTIIVRPGDVLCFGGSAARSSDYQISFPDSLRKEWEKDLAAGTGAGSPLMLDSMVLSGTLRGELCALNVRNGKSLGSIKLDDAIPGSPVIDGNLVILPMSGGSESVAAYNLNDGRVFWRKAYGDVEMSLLLLRKRVYFGTLAGTAYCIERATGDVVWKYELPENKMFDGFHASPSANDSTIFFGCDNGSLYALRAVDGTVRWHSKTVGPMMGGSALSNGAVIATTINGKVAAFDELSGEVRWERDLGSPVYAPPAVRSDTIIVGAIDGYVRALSVSDGSELWRTNVEGPVDAGAVLAGDKAYIGTLKKRFCALRIADGSVVWSRELDGRIKSPAVVGYNKVFVTTDEYTLFCFGGAE